MKRDVFSKLTLFFSCLFFIGVLLFFLFNDYWQDEIYTLYHFVFVSTATTITDYHSTNNHVLFSLLCNGLRQFMGFNQLSEVLLHPYLLRSIPVVISIISILVFYKKTTTNYNSEAAKISSSIWLTTFPLLCFATQFRGYSLSILIVSLQYFSFIKIVKSNRIILWQWLLLFVFTSLSLLCLPTNIYIEASYLLLCAGLFVLPSFAVAFLKTAISRSTLVKMASAIALGCVWTIFYYRWMLMQQPKNEFIATYHPFAIANLSQSLSILYHFFGYRLYLPIFLIVSVAFMMRKTLKKQTGYIPFLLPAFLFFAPFLFFFVHGAIIIQRTFLSLIPFFALMTGLSIQYLKTIRFYKPVFHTVLFLNLLCVAITFCSFVNDSRKNNTTENHQQDLIQHYYLIHFNALETTKLSKEITSKKHIPLYLDDGFGQTGIDYYLSAFNIPFTRVNDSITLKSPCLILTNLKSKTVHKLTEEKKSYQRFLQPDEQYNLFDCGGN